MTSLEAAIRANSSYGPPSSNESPRSSPKTSIPIVMQRISVPHSNDEHNILEQQMPTQDEPMYVMSSLTQSKGPAETDDEGGGTDIRSTVLRADAPEFSPSNISFDHSSTLRQTGIDTLKFFPRDEPGSVRRARLPVFQKLTEISSVKSTVSSIEQRIREDSVEAIKPIFTKSPRSFESPVRQTISIDHVSTATSSNEPLVSDAGRTLESIRTVETFKPVLVALAEILDQQSPAIAKALRHIINTETEIRVLQERLHMIWIEMMKVQSSQTLLDFVQDLINL